MNVIDAAHIEGQRAFSLKTFGPGARTKGVLNHIREELDEIEKTPDDITEWADVIILALDGAWRAGFEPQQIIDAVIAKQRMNEGRVWPNWQDFPEDQPINHDRSND